MGVRGTEFIGKAGSNLIFLVAEIVALTSYSVPWVFKQKDYGFEMNGIKTNMNFIYFVNKV